MDNYYSMNIITRISAVFSILLIFLLISHSVEAKRQKKEADYVNQYCSGQIEYRLFDRTRVDCLTKTEAQEFDFSDKWMECLTQARYYAVMTARKPVCFLIMENESDEKYIKRARLVQRSTCPRMKIVTLKNGIVREYD